MQPMALQAIMRANAGAQRPQSQPKKATGVELKQINKVDAMAETKLQKRQLGEKPLNTDQLNSYRSPGD